MEIIDVEQVTEDWKKLRIGSIGGSSIADVVAGGQGKMRKSLMYRLAGEILSGEKYEGYSNAHMDRGIEQEAEARALYSLTTGLAVRQVGLVRDTQYTHYSPDGLCDPDGVLEIKCTIPSVHIETILENEIPSAYRRQCQWGLHICQRRWVDFVSYSPTVQDKPLWIIRAGRDEKLIAELKAGADKFVLEMLTILRKVKEA